MVWTRPNANQYHVCTMGSGIGGMGGGGGGGGGVSVEQAMLYLCLAICLYSIVPVGGR